MVAWSSIPRPDPAAFRAHGTGHVDHISADLGGFVRAVFSMHDPGSVAGLLRGAGLVEVTTVESTATLRLGAPAEFLWQYMDLHPMGPLIAQALAATQIHGAPGE